MERLRKVWMPWMAAEQFATEAAFRHWLDRRLKAFGNLRLVLLLAATALLVGGYVADQRPVMLLAVIPLALVLLVSIAMGKTEETLDQMNKSQS